MAQKTLNTRIQLKNADLNSWNNSQLVLLAGEVALAKVLTTQVASDGNTIQVPTYLMKVGDGSKKFSELNWLAAPSSDVYTWAKKAELEYDDLPETLRNEIDELQGAIGNGGSVQNQITAAINAAIEGLDSADTSVEKQFVTAVVQTNGEITVTRRALVAADIPTLAISKIDGLQTALDNKAPLADFNTLKNTVGDATKGLVKSLAEEVANRISEDEALGRRIDGIVNTTIPELVADIENNTDAAAEAARLAGVAQSEVDDLEVVVGTLTQTVATNKSNIEQALATEKSEREAADSTLQDAIDALELAIGNVTNLMNFRGAVTAKTAITDAKEGDVIVVTDGNDKGKEFVYSDGSWVEFGSVDAQQTAIDGLQTRMSTAEGKIINLENTRATKSELEAAQAALQDNINLKADQIALNATNSKVGDLETSVGTSDSAGLRKRVKDLEGSVGTSDSTGLRKKVADLESVSATHATKSYVDSQDQAIQGALADECSRAEDAEAALDQKFEGLRTDHNGLATRVGTISENVETLQTAVDTINNTKIPSLATKSDLTALTGRVDVIENDYLKAEDTYIFNCGDHTA